MTSLIIGDGSDSHVAAVVRVISRAVKSKPLILDGPALQQYGFSLTLDRIRHRNVTVEIQDQNTHGWLRRYAPSMWGAGTVTGSLDAVTKRAFLALVGAITRIGAVQWLTPLDAMLNAEDRIVQLEAARQLGYRIPETVVTSDPGEAAEVLGSAFVVKPLLGGYFLSAEGPKAVFTSRIDAAQFPRIDFAKAPFVAQEMLTAKAHLRIVTVGSQAWMASLGAENRPLDWRQQDEAHFAWVPTEDPETCGQAVQLAKSLGVGYSSQDWIRDKQGVVFLDLNPAGQWLFLPPAISDSVTESVAQFLFT